MEDARKRTEGIRGMLKTLGEEDASYQRYGTPTEGIHVVTIGPLITDEESMQQTAMRAATRLEINLGAIGLWFS